MKAIEQHCQMALFIMLYKVVVTFKSVDETLVCDHSNESCCALPPLGAVYYAVRGFLTLTIEWTIWLTIVLLGGSNFSVCR